MILVIKHIAIEGPGTLGHYLEKQEIKYRIIELADGESLPDNLDGISGVVVLGGPMNVYEEDKHQYLKAENILIQDVLKREIPYLGICLGSQLLAKAAGAKVGKSPVAEHGFALIDQTEHGQRDPLFGGLGAQLIGFQWHEDTFEAPQSSALLSSAKECANQAIRVGANAYGLQYHIEVDKDIIESWIKKYFKVERAEESEKGKQMLAQYDQLKAQFNAQAEAIYGNFREIIKCFEREKAAR